MGVSFSTYPTHPRPPDWLCSMNRLVGLGINVVRATVARVRASNDAAALGRLSLYVGLSSGLVIWGSYMVVLVKAIVGV